MFTSGDNAAEVRQLFCFVAPNWKCHEFMMYWHFFHFFARVFLPRPECLRLSLEAIKNRENAYLLLFCISGMFSRLIWLYIQSKDKWRSLQARFYEFHSMGIGQCSNSVQIYLLLPIKCRVIQTQNNVQLHEINKLNAFTKSKYLEWAIFYAIIFICVYSLQLPVSAHFMPSTKAHNGNHT